MRKPIAKRPAVGKTQSKGAIAAPAAPSVSPKPKPAHPAAQSLAPGPESKPIAVEAQPPLEMMKKAKAKPTKAVSKGRDEPLNFRVTADFRRAFKRAAAAQDCKKVDLLERIFHEWSAGNPA